MRIYKICMSQAIQGTIAGNLCKYFLEHALFLKQSGEFEILSWFISYKLFLSYQWPKNAYILS